MRKLSLLAAAFLVSVYGTAGLAETRRAAPATVSPPAPSGPADWNDGRYRFRAEETTAIQEYYRAHPSDSTSPDGKKKKKKLPPGLRKKVERGGQLPPGWQKKVARGEVMDPVVYRQSKSLPPTLVGHLPPQPAGTVVVEIEGKVVRLVEATLTILDVFDLLGR